MKKECFSNNNILPFICRSPELDTLILALGRTGAPSRYHVITGGGLPRARQGRTATDLTGNVWFAGPRAITGGGWSSGATTRNRARPKAEPAALTAEQATKAPESFRVAPCKNRK